MPAGAIDPNRDLLGEFIGDGFTYVPDSTSLNAVPAGTPKLLGLFNFSNMNVAKDKIDKRRNPGAHGVVDDFGFPDQPMLDEMTDKALQVLSQNPNGFVAMIEGGSIDKMAHLMDSERWILDTIEFDRAVERCREFALEHPDTLVIVTADHECAGAHVIERCNAGGPIGERLERDLLATGKRQQEGADENAADQLRVHSTFRG